MSTCYISTANADAYMAQFLRMVAETPVGVFRTIRMKQETRNSSGENPQYTDFERTFTAIQRGKGKYIYSFTNNPSRMDAMGFHDQHLNVVAIEVAGTIYMVDSYGFNIGVSCFLQEDFLKKAVGASNLKVVLFQDYYKEVHNDIIAAMQDAYDQLPAEDILSDEDKEEITKNLRKYTISVKRQENLTNLTCYPFPVVETKTVAEILCGEATQEAIIAARIAQERDAMVLHKAVRDFTLAQIQEAYENPNKHLRIAMALNEHASSAKCVWVAFSANDRIEKLKMEVWRLRSLLDGTNIYLNYWDFCNKRSAEIALERLQLDVLFVANIDSVEFNGSIIYADAD